MSRHSKVDRAKVVALAAEGCSNQIIAQRTGLHKSFVERWAKRGRGPSPQLEDRPRPGGRRKLSTGQVKQLVKSTAGKRRKSSRKVAAAWRARGGGKPKITYRTAQNYLRREGLRPFHRRKAPRLTAEHMLRRRSFARAHRKTCWRAVLFVDEKKFSRYAHVNNKNDVVWAYTADAVPGYEVLQHGPELMVWGGICARGVAPLYRIKGTLRSPQYIEILKHVALPAADSLFPGSSSRTTP